MRSWQKPFPAIALLGAVTMAGSGEQVFAAFVEDFEGHADGTAASDIGWTAPGVTVSNTAGFDGSLGLNIPGTSSGGGHFTELGENGVSVAAGEFIFQAKVRLNPEQIDPAGTRNEVFLQETGGVHGFLIAKFTAGSSSTGISVSTGHTAGGTSNWGSQGQASVAGASWQSNVWYQIEFAGTLSDTGDGTAATGMLNIWEVNNPSNMIVTDHEVIGFGSSDDNPFDLIDRIQFRSWTVGASVAGWQVDDIVLIPEPASLGLLGLAGLMALRRRR